MLIVLARLYGLNSKMTKLISLICCREVGKKEARLLLMRERRCSVVVGSVGTKGGRGS